MESDAARRRVDDGGTGHSVRVCVRVQCACARACACGVKPLMANGDKHDIVQATVSV